MATKRVIGVITVMNNKAVQSFGYQNYLPLGCPKVLAENLDRWGADEILILDISASKKDVGPNLQLLSSLQGIYLSTPLIYGGGIRNKEDAKCVIQNGADRIVIETIANRDLAKVEKIAHEIGKQAIIRSICIVEKEDKYYQYSYLDKSLKEIDLNILNGTNNSDIYSEVMLVDVMNEGENGKFNSNLINIIDGKQKLIAYGGVGTGTTAISQMAEQKICAIAIGNQLNYTEESIYMLKDMINNQPIRKSNIVLK